MTETEQKQIDLIIINALQEDQGAGDHTSLACLSPKDVAKAFLWSKDNGIIAGVEVAKRIGNIIDPDLQWKMYKYDGDEIASGDLIFEISGNARHILLSERLILNFMQRMSGIATHTRYLANKIAHTSTKLIDTRKTTPGFRLPEKMAVRIGGGINHRMGLYDMIMIKDNHADFSGGLLQAMNRAQKYLHDNQLDIPVEVETRNLDEVQLAIAHPVVNRIMLDNFTPEVIRKALQIIPSHIQTEASGGINEYNVAAYAETGVNYISVGALTHQIRSLDLSLKAHA